MSHCSKQRLIKRLLVVGHSAAKSGAVNLSSGVSEFDFNSKLAARIGELVLANPRIQLSVIYRKSYRRLPEEVNTLNPDFCLSLHCNAFDTQTSGTQTLYYHTYEQSKALAEVVQREIVKCLGLRDRGVVGVTDSGRGAHILKNIKAPCVIVESFFIDNDLDVKRANERFEDLARSFARFIQHRVGGCFS